MDIDDYSHFKHLPFNTHLVTEDIKLKAEKELFETYDVKHISIAKLRILLKGEPGLEFPEEDEFLLQFLRARKYDINKAFTLCKNYFDRRRDPIIGKISPAVVFKTCSFNIYGILPFRDKDGCTILYFSTSKWNTRDVSALELLQTNVAYYTMANSFPASQISGYKAIFDFGNFTLWHAISITPWFIWKFIDILQNSFPARLKGLHIINEGPLFRYIWNIAKAVLNKKLMNRVHLHGKNVKELLNYFDASILPSECGGELGKFDSSATEREFKLYQSAFERLQTFGYKSN